MNFLDSVRFLRSAYSRRFASVAHPGALALLATSLGFSLAACTEPVPAIVISSMRIAPQIDSFFVGRTAATNTFTVTLLDAAGQEIKDGRPVTYSSSAPTVFTVASATGLITGKALGTGFLRATASGRFVEAGIKIINPVASIQLLPGDFGFTVGTTRQLIANLYATDGSTISNRAVTFASSNPGVVSINVGGVVTAVAEGTATITASVEGKSASITGTVAKETVASVRLSPALAPVQRVGGQLQITALALNNLGQPLPGRIASWISSNPTVASVSTSGVVSALSVGSANITAEIEGRTANLQLNVTEIPPISVTISPDTFQLASGTTRQIIPVVIDSTGRVAQNLNSRQVVWQSSNLAVANVSLTGVVTGTGAGSARLSVTVDGIRSNEIVVQVSQTVASVTLSPSATQILRVGGTVQVTATPKDNQGVVIVGRTVIWTSNNPTIASVSSSGLVTAIAVGGTSITADIDGVSRSLNVTVTLVPIGSVTYTPSRDTLVAGDVMQYNAVVKDTAGRTLTTLVGRSLSTQSNNTPVATLTTVGVVNAIAQGVAVLVLTVDGVASNDLTITVAQVASVTVTPSPGTVSVGATLQLTAVLKDIQGNVLTTSRAITWSTNSPNFALVSPAGIVTGVAAGQATITAQINGVIGQSIVTVVP